jgi:hypothetical protein
MLPALDGPRTPLPLDVEDLLYLVRICRMMRANASRAGDYEGEIYAEGKLKLARAALITSRRGRARR